MKHRRYTFTRWFRKLRRFAVICLKRLVPFKGRVGWEFQVGALVVLLWHKDKHTERITWLQRDGGRNHPPGTNLRPPRLALWLDPHWRDFRLIPG